MRQGNYEPNFINDAEFDASRIMLDVPENMRPKVCRKMGLDLEWDKKVDGMSLKELPIIRKFGAQLCRTYRRFRPRVIGDRCFYEPSCSRYAELCLHHFGLIKTIKLTIARLKKCDTEGCGGIDIPLGIDKE